jgi:tRNA(Ile)-lysidine synthase TilS/MesJ
MAYVEERLIRRFVKEEKIIHDSCVCPHSETSKRVMMGKIITGIERVCPDVKKNIFRSVKRVKSQYLL